MASPYSATWRHDVASELDAKQPLDPTLTSIVNGSWTPTMTGVSNIAASTPEACYYTRIGTQVFCWGRCAIDPTAAAPTGSEIGISLPIASSLAAAGDLTGNASSSINSPGLIRADPTNDRAALFFRAENVANTDWSFFFAYRII